MQQPAYDGRAAALWAASCKHILNSLSFLYLFFWIYYFCFHGNIPSITFIYVHMLLCNQKKKMNIKALSKIKPGTWAVGYDMHASMLSE